MARRPTRAVLTVAGHAAQSRAFQVGARVVRVQLVLFAAVAALALPGAATASVPPSTWKPATWTGPAKVCAEGFAFDLQAGETARQGWPSVGRIAYQVETAKGRLSVIELWAAGPPEVRGRAEVRPGGRLYPLTEASRLVDADTVAEYLFKPKGDNGLPVTVHFYRADGVDWAPVDLEAVLNRIDFARLVRPDCTAPDKP